MIIQTWKPCLNAHRWIDIESNSIVEAAQVNDTVGTPTPSGFLWIPCGQLVFEQPDQSLSEAVATHSVSN